MKEANNHFNLEEFYLELDKEVKREFNVVDNTKVMIMGIGDAISHKLNLLRMNQNEIYKNNLKYSFVSTSSSAINNTLGKIWFPQSQKTNYYNNIDFLEIGSNITKGLGAGGNPEKALKAFAESEKEIDEFLKKKLEGIELVIMIAALGGGTGTAITPLMNQKIKKMKIPLINVISLPFQWEGNKRNSIATKYISKFYETADKVIIINHSEIINMAEKVTKRKMDIFDSFHLLDSEYPKLVELIYESFLYLEMNHKISKEKYLEMIKDKNIKFRYKNEFFIDLNKNELESQIENYFENKENIKFLVVKVKGNKNLYNLYQVIESLNKRIYKEAVILGYLEQNDSITSKIGISFIVGEGSQ